MLFSRYMFGGAGKGELWRLTLTVLVATIDAQ